MDVKQAVEILEKLGADAADRDVENAIKMAVLALELQDGNIHLDKYGGMQIGTIKGNVYM